MKRSLWLVLLVLGVTACGGATTATTTAAPTAPSAAQVVEADLSGLAFEVHKAPG